MAGLYIILGHALLEGILILILLTGLYILFQNVILLFLIGIIGGSLLFLYGLLTLKNIKNKDFEIEFSTLNNKKREVHRNSFLGGIILSLSNPYWILWWSVTGLSLMINLNVTILNPIALLLFFLGHELGDLVWYVPVSISVYLGGKSLRPSIYKWILIFSAVFMMVFGFFLILNTVLNPPIS
jgi:threonine/homoserine/homoserine lactone efflux protein